MPYQKVEVPGARVDILSWTNHELSREEHDMLRNTSRLPCIFKHVALMADGHLGIGAMVGSVVATKNAIVPATVGIDIGCGMMAVKTPFKSSDLDGKLQELYTAIEKAIPVGFNENSRSLIRANSESWDGFNRFEQLHADVQDRKVKAMNQLGSLGGGNHFVEICVDTATETDVWIVLHSGSRNIGKELAERHIATAKSLHRLNELPDPDLAYFIQGTDEFANYWNDVKWAQEYALKNREVMMNRIIRIFANMFNKGKMFRSEISVNCHHNYVAEERHFDENVFVTRKGAVRAGVGDYGIIPGSMGARSYIVRGKGLAESFDSCSHGAGRTMSRGQAKRTYTLEDLAAQTEGIVCRKDAGVIDEIPSAYKNIETVMRNQADLVEVVEEIKQIICLKG